ncbi:MAG: response regulator [Planctomycetales bacterium]|nr:response regulator [Planctomycetales bacterium]
MSGSRRVLLIDDNPIDRNLVSRELRESMPDVQLTEVVGQRQLDEYCADGNFDIVITDSQMSWTTGIDVLRAVKARCPHCPVIMYTGTGSEETAVAAMKLGLDDYIVKNATHLVRLGVAAESAIERAAIRARAEEISAELDQVKSRSRLLFNESKEGVCMFSPTRGVVEANASFAAMIGVDDPVRAVGMQPWQWDDIYSSLEKIKARWPTPIQCAETFETRFRRPDGSVIDVEISSTPTEQFGEYIIFQVCRDITHRKAAAAALEQSERHLEAAQFQAEIGSWECDSQWQFDVWSQEMYRLFDRDSEAGLPTFEQFLEYVHPDDRTLITGGPDRNSTSRLGRVLQPQPMPLHHEGHHEHRTSRYRYRIIRHDGSVRYVEETIRAAEVSEDGRVTRWLGTTMDVSDEVNAETTLRESTERFLRALNHIPDVVVIYDSDLRIRFINDAVTTIIGLPPEDCIGKQDAEIWPEQVCDSYHPVLQEALVNHISTTAELRVDLPDAENCHLSVHCIPLLKSENEVREIVAVISDLTKHSELLTQLLHAQKMESVGRLAGGIAHDFNNVLTVVLNSVALARLRSPSADVLSDLEMIEEAGQRGAVLTRQLLSFSRQGRVTPTVLDLNRVVEEISLMLRRLLGDQIEIVVVADANPSQIVADAGQLEQVLVNLAVNASDAMPGGGQLTIQTLFESDPPGLGFVKLMITDTGIGMDSVIRQRIFAPYVTTKPVGKGTGLGLSTVYGIVKSSHGEITVESQLGHGTSFHLRFPLATGNELDARQPIRKCSPQGSGVILIVEDDLTLQNVANQILTASGFDVVAVNDGSEAIEFIQNTNDPIQLVFTDAVMPNTTGWQLREYLLEHHPEIRVLGTSGNLDETIRGPTQRFDWDHFIPKPYSMKQLAEKIRNVLDARND